MSVLTLAVAVDQTANISDVANAMADLARLTNCEIATEFHGIPLLAELGLAAGPAWIENQFHDARRRRGRPRAPEDSIPRDLEALIQWLTEKARIADNRPDARDGWIEAAILREAADKVTVILAKVRHT